MSNPLPTGAIPKLYRQRNKEGKEVGAWYCPKVKGKLDKAVNLKTQDYFKARKRAMELLYSGRRDFPDDRYFDESGAPVPPADAPKTPPSDDWTADAYRAATQTVEPDAYFPPGSSPPPQPDPIPGDAPRVDAETPKSDAEGNTQIPPEMLEGICEQLATVAVELQLHAQEYVWLRWAKMDPGFVPPDSDARKVPAELWKRQLKKWLPTDVPIPEWAAAIILTAFMGGMVQFDGAKPIPQPPPEAPQT
jgi:hypothetical protein